MQFAETSIFKRYVKFKSIAHLYCFTKCLIFVFIPFTFCRDQWCLYCLWALWFQVHNLVFHPCSKRQYLTCASVADLWQKNRLMISLKDHWGVCELRPSSYFSRHSWETERKSQKMKTKCEIAFIEQFVPGLKSVWMPLPIIS